MRIGVVGVNHKLADLKLREMLAKVCQKRFGAGQSLHGEHAFILLLTCNRMEIYFSSEDLAETHSYFLKVLKQEIDEDFDQKLYSYFGEECFAHLATVAAGLDSAIIAETEIQGQVRNAYEGTLGFCKLPFSLHYLFQKSLKISKDIRSKYALGRGLPDLEHAIYQTGSHLFKKPENASVLIVGASEINQKVLSYLKRKGCGQITLCNRSQRNAEKMSAIHQIPLLHWEGLSHWYRYDWIILGTKASEFLITNKCLSHSFTDKKLIIDLALPRNADPRIAKDPRIQLLNIDQINRILKFRRHGLNDALKSAYEEIVQQVGRQIEIYSARGGRSNSYCVA